MNKRNIHLLLLGRTTSKFGAAFYLAVLPLYILKSTGSLALSGLFFSLASLPALLITPLIGVAIEQLDRKWLIVVCDLLTALIYFALRLCTILSEHYVLLLLIGSLLINLLAHTFEISSKLLFSELVPSEELEHYNGLKSIFDNASAVIAPALGTICFGLWGFSSILTIVGIAYSLSAFQELWIMYTPSKVNFSQTKGHPFTQILEGLRYLKEDHHILPLFALVMALNFFVANADEIINPGILVSKYHLSEKLFGFTSSATVIGTLFAGLIIYKCRSMNLKAHMKQLFILNSLVMILLGLLSLFMTKLPLAYYFIFLLLEFVLGVITSFVNIPLISSFQADIPLNYQGRFFSLLTVASGLLIPLGISYTGFLSTLVGADIAYIINNLCVILIVLLSAKKGAI